jgi:hypothetical protein
MKSMNSKRIRSMQSRPILPALTSHDCRQVHASKRQLGSSRYQQSYGIYRTRRANATWLFNVDDPTGRALS